MVLAQEQEMTAKEILELIERVEPVDGAGLDRVDDAVDHYLGREPQLIYTRSRDALKAMRGQLGQGGLQWWVQAQGDGQAVSVISKVDETGDYIYRLSSGFQKTEELAELHAIIQAIEYERNEE